MPHFQRLNPLNSSRYFARLPPSFKRAVPSFTITGISSIDSHSPIPPARMQSVMGYMVVTATFHDDICAHWMYGDHHRLVRRIRLAM